MIEKILEYDKNFDESVFLTRIDHIMIMILGGIMENNMKDVKHYLSDETYDKFTTLVEDYKSKGITRIFGEMNIKNSSISNVEIVDNKINITCNIITRYMDYFVDSDGNYISGINNHRIERNNTIVFSKRVDASELLSARRCPNCGKTLDINASGVCPYCNGTFNMEKYDYIVSKMDLI